jgi:hypothetical protein
MKTGDCLRGAAAWPTISIQENQSEIKDQFTCSLPVTPADNPQESSNGNNQGREICKPPDDELHRQGGSDIRSQNNGKRAVKAD